MVKIKLLMLFYVYVVLNMLNMQFFSPLKLQWTKDSLKNAVWNCWCFWRHKLPCNQLCQHV